MIIVYIQAIKSGIIPATINPEGLSNAELCQPNAGAFLGTDRSGNNYLVGDFYSSDNGRLFARDFIQLPA